VRIGLFLKEMQNHSGAILSHYSYSYFGGSASLVKRALFWLQRALFWLQEWSSAIGWHRFDWLKIDFEQTSPLLKKGLFLADNVT